jgi:hypothetical protein
MTEPIPMHIQALRTQIFDISSNDEEKQALCDKIDAMISKIPEGSREEFSISCTHLTKILNNVEGISKIIAGHRKSEHFFER